MIIGQLSILPLKIERTSSKATVLVKKGGRERDC